MLNDAGPRNVKNLYFALSIEAPFVCRGHVAGGWRKHPQTA